MLTEIFFKEVQELRNRHPLDHLRLERWSEEQTLLTWQLNHQRLMLMKHLQLTLRQMRRLMKMSQTKYVMLAVLREDKDEESLRLR